ncbi:pyroglutamyl-peptidase I [Ammoniphilus sp. YIM 78166]|uniref:pyroglutamyl-peptidase I n=1 Tax=Ammoniphilus sp. YIM 78166 TaxID=1644106 RepID=UPI00142FC89B|nr:pyroglutamyl-peptidase I [Ammoniphilus sp. YIM 78166]
MKILVTGFEPFGGMGLNPTEAILKDIGKEEFEGAEIYTVLLPVNYDECAEKIIGEIERISPDAVISCGLYAGRTAITPERIGINMKDTMGEDPIADNRGIKPIDERINPEGPDGLFSTLPNRQITYNLLKRGIPSFISNTAGTFICNNTLYAVLDYIRRNDLSIIAGFIHFPASTAMAVEKQTLPSLPHQTMVEGLKIIIETVIDDRKRK